MPIADRKFKTLTLANVDRSPKKPGVYALYAGRTLTYLGQAPGKKATLRSKLRGHLGTAPQAATRYKREVSEEPEARLDVLLEEYVAAHGRLPSQNAERK